MQSPQLTAYLKRLQFTSTAIWSAMVVSVLFYWVLTTMMTDSGALAEFAAKGAAESYVPLLQRLALPVCTGAALISLAVGRFFLTPTRIQAAINKETTAQELATGKNGQLDSKRFELLSNMPRKELPYCNLVPLSVNAMMFRLLAADVIAIYGFVLTLFAGDPAVATPYLAGALVLMVLAFPRLPSFVGKQQQQASLTHP